jgi:uncharacterized coiled-coil DUF342 family protein
MSDRFAKVKEFASEKLTDLGTTLSTQREIRGLQKQIADLVGERDRVMVEIGHKVYSLYGRGKVRNADILPLCERIDEIGKRIDKLNSQVRELAKPKPKGVLTEADLADDTELAEETEEEDESSAEVEEDAPEAPSDEPEEAPDEGPKPE